MQATILSHGTSGEEQPGLFGIPEAFAVTVEEQG
jgi:hypothetical protein